MSELLISLWGPANPLFVRDKYVTPSGKRLYISYVQKFRSTYQKYHLTAHIAVNDKCMWFSK